eukprot:SAG22_NODE_1482_length_4325_cov_1.709250_4_plen_134_part_00
MMWMALDTIDATNGLLRYVPGSHLAGVHAHESSHTLGFSQTIIGYDGSPPQSREVSLGTLAPGDVIVHHCNAIHSADANMNVDASRHRRTVALVFTGVSAVQDKVALQEYLDDHDRQVAARRAAASEGKPARL